MTLLLFSDAALCHKNHMTTLHNTWLLVRNAMTPSAALCFLLKYFQLKRQIVI